MLAEYNMAGSEEQNPLTSDLDVNQALRNSAIAARTYVKTVDVRHRIALIDAVYSESDNMVRTLIRYGADLNKTDLDWKTALIHAVENKKEKAAIALIEAGADVNKQDKWMRTSLIHAVLNKNEFLAAALIQKGAKVNAVDINKRTALIYAVCLKNDALVHALINAGADLDVADLGRKTALIRAMENRNEAAVVALIKAGADVNKRDKWKRTALIHAVLLEDEYLVAALIGPNTDVNATDVNKKSALVYAFEDNLENIALKLIAAGADVNLADNQSKTPLILAAENHATDYLCVPLLRADDKSALNQTVVDNFQKFICLCFEMIKDERITNEYWLSCVSDELNNEKDMLDGITEVGSESMGALSSTDDSEAVRSVIFKAFENVRAYSHEWKKVLINAIQNDKHVVQKLVDNGVDVILSEYDTRSAVMCTARLEYAIIVQGMTDTKSSLSERQNKGSAWIEDFVARITKNERKPALLSSLIKAGADVKTTDVDGKSALIYALQKKKKYLANTLIHLGADVNIFDKDGRTALVYAVKNNEDRDIVQTLINAGSELDCTDNKGKTALVYAILNGNHCLTQALIEAGADVNITDVSSKSALIYAIECKNAGLAKTLIENGSDVSITNDKYKTALMYCASNKDVSLARTLIDAGVNVDKTDKDYRSALIHAVQNRNKPLVTLLTSRQEADVNITDKEYKSALIHAVQNNEDIDLVQALIEAGADLDIIDKEERTALIYAIQNENIALTTALIDAGADVNIADCENTTALMHAIQKENSTLARKLIQAESDTNFTDSTEKTALIYAAQHNLESVVDELLSVGTDVNITDNERKTGLFYAVHNESLVHTLINHGADATWEDNHSRTPLFYAVDQFVVRELVEHGKCSVNSRDVYGRTSLCYALTQSLASAEYLLEKGADIDVKDYSGLSGLAIFIDSLLRRKIDKSYLLDGLRVLFNIRVSPSTVFNAIINTIFCRILSSSLVVTPILDALTIASQYAFEYDENTSAVIQNILVLLRDLKNNLDSICYDIHNRESKWESLVPNILRLLIWLGANPNSPDSDGNTALHYATCLPFMGVSQKTIMEICIQLETFGVLFNVKNLQGETPLLFSLQRVITEKQINIISRINELVRVFGFLLEHQSSLEETTADGKTILHLILDLFNQGLLQKNARNILGVALELFGLFSSAKILTRRGIVNRRTTNLNSPLHLWASLRLNSEQQYDKCIWQSTEFLKSEGEDEDANKGYESLTQKILYFKELLKTIFNYLLKCGAKLNDRNAEEETPLHLCKTWYAVKLLLDAGANPKDVDSSGRPPLLAAAKKRKFHQRSTRLYPDVSEEPKLFWINVLEKGLDLWTVDKKGDSILGILIASDTFTLAEALVKVAVEKNYIHSDTIALFLLNTICKDKSPRGNWKGFLVEEILKSRKRPISVKSKQDTPLHHCCRNIVINSEESSVHWRIAKLLVSYGGDCRVSNERGETSHDISDKCPALRKLLEEPVNIDELPVLIPWVSISKKHLPLLAKAARGQECEHVEPFRYHSNHFARGSFGLVFAGINEKDGREVAIKRSEKLRMRGPEVKKEIKSLIALADCQHVVQYLDFFEDKNFCYVVFELMEGNLEEYLDVAIGEQKKVKLCMDVVRGLSFLHEQGFLHRDLKPSNILYRCHPKLCLKIADFGLSRRIDSTGQSTTVFRTNMGTRCWIAPELLMQKSFEESIHSKSTDVFACGLILHYILSAKRHPFFPPDYEHRNLFQVTNEAEKNICEGKMEGWNRSLCPEVSHLITGLLQSDESKRPTARAALTHPLFWTKKRKIDLLIAVGNQPEISCPRDKRPTPLTNVENDLEVKLTKYANWNSPSYKHMPAIYTEMTRSRRGYKTNSVVELIRFVRNAIAHVSDFGRPNPIRKQLLEEFVFLKYFRDLPIEVYKTVTINGWDQTREEIKRVINEWQESELPCPT